MNCTELGYKVGDKFKVIYECSTATIGDIVTLVEDDGTYCPYFTGTTHSEYLNYEKVAIKLGNLKKIENKIDLYRKYVAVVDMCKGTVLEDTPWRCVKSNGAGGYIDHPKFTESPDRYEFAVAILEGKPVFIGDPVYSKYGDEFDWSDPNYLQQINYPGVWTWDKRRTFMLNGITLPSPKEGTREEGVVLNIHNYDFYFENIDDMLRVRNAFVTLLNQALNERTNS